MKFKFIGERKMEFGMIGIVEPGQEFDINNEEFLPVFIGNPRFEEIKSKEVVKKEVIKDEEGE